MSLRAHHCVFYNAPWCVFFTGNLIIPRIFALRAGLSAVPAFASKILGAQIARLRVSASAVETAFAAATIPHAFFFSNFYNFADNDYVQVSKRDFLNFTIDFFGSIISAMNEVLNDADYEMFRKLIYDESGITFSATNRSILDSRIRELLRKKNIATPKEYYANVIKNNEEMKEMLDSVTTNLTRFFRNQPHFDAFEKYVIPQVMEHKRSHATDRTIRVWSAGCSTGEEPYTIAMVLKEILPPGWDFKITASDISLKCLMTAQNGFYPNAKVDGIPANYLQKYFTKTENGYQVKDELKNHVHFDYHNLKNDSGIRNLDVVFCRNVLIYFDEAAQIKVINHFWDDMAPQSYLFIGHSESLFGMNTGFEFLKTDWACLYKKNLH